LRETGGIRIRFQSEMDLPMKMLFFKALICGGTFALLAISNPAHAQLTPVYGSLRTALENSMAQSLPPYGKPAAQSAGANTEKSASVPERGPDTAMNNAAQGATQSGRGGNQPAP
jgi:hypothetical protein